MPRAYSMENRAQKREETRSRLLHAASELIVEQGKIDQTLTAVAVRADVAVRTVYNHFDSFGELLAEAMSAITEEFSVMAPEPVEDHRLAPRSALELLVSQWFDEISKNYDRLAALIAVGDSVELKQALADARQLRLQRVRAVLKLAQARGQLRVPLESAVAVAYSATGYHAWVSLVHDLGLSSTEAARLVTESVLAFAFEGGVSQ